MHHFSALFILIFLKSQRKNSDYGRIKAGTMDENWRDWFKWMRLLLLLGSGLALNTCMHVMCVITLCEVILVVSVDVFTLVLGWLHVDVSRSRMWMWLFQPRPGLSHCSSKQIKYI